MLLGDCPASLLLFLLRPNAAAAGERLALRTLARIRSHQLQRSGAQIIVDGGRRPRALQGQGQRARSVRSLEVHQMMLEVAGGRRAHGRGSVRNDVAADAPPVPKLKYPV